MTSEPASAVVATREITFGQAVREALAEEMRRDPTVFIIGEDVAEAGTPFKVLSGLVEEFGPARVIDSPISEAGITGLAVGAAMAGMRPVVDVESAMSWWVADVKAGGRDVTIVATGSMVQVALRAAEMLSPLGISAEVIDPRTTVPLDARALVDSARKTSRVMVMDEGYERYGVTAELAAVIAEGAFHYLDAPVKRLGAMHVPVPFSPVLEDLTVPTPERVVEIAKTLCGKR